MKKKGQSTIELALIIPVMLAIIIWLVSTGFQFYSVVAVNNAAREAARHAAVYGIEESGADPAAFQAVVESNLNVVAPPNTDFDIDNDVEVRWRIDGADPGVDEQSFWGQGQEDNVWVHAVIEYEYEPLFHLGQFTRLLFTDKKNAETITLHGEAVFLNERFID